MRLSRKRLQREATTTGFRVEILEKVAQLLDLLDGFNRHPYLKGRLALKGGTALNLFVFDVPRLSIDIDLNYVGQLDREAMLAERPEVERAIEAVCGRAGIAIDRAPGAHAGGKWRLRYASADGRRQARGPPRAPGDPRSVRRAPPPAPRRPRPAAATNRVRGLRRDEPQGLANGLGRRHHLRAARAQESARPDPAARGPRRCDRPDRLGAVAQ